MSQQVHKRIEEDFGAVSDKEEMVAIPVSTTPGKPTFLQGERWKAVQRTKLRGMSIPCPRLIIGKREDSL